TPTVSIVRKTGLTEEFPYEHVSLQVNYVEGFDGENIFLMKASDAAIISDIMLGGSGEEVNEELSDIALSAVQEAMNQMMGSSATSMSTVFSKRVDISPPVVEYEDIDKLEEVYEKIDEEVFVKVSFQLKVGDLIDSNIMQLIPLNFAKELVNNLLEPEPESIAEEQSESVLEEAEVGNIPAQQQATEQSKDEPDSEEPQQIGVKAQKNAPVQTAYVTESQPVDLSEILELVTTCSSDIEKLGSKQVDILVNNKLNSKGEVVVIEEIFGVRVTDIVSKADRLKNLN